jgi:hypothetical protein
MDLVGRAADPPRRLCRESWADNESRREPCLRRGTLSAMASRGRLAFGLTVGGVAWGLVFVAAAFFVPVYGGASISSTGVVVSTAGTLVGVNGVWVIAPVAVPFVLISLAWFGLHRKCSRGAKAGGYRLGLCDRAWRGQCCRRRFDWAVHCPGRVAACGCREADADRTGDDFGVRSLRGWLMTELLPEFRRWLCVAGSTASSLRSGTTGCLRSIGCAGGCCCGTRRCRSRSSCSTCSRSTESRGCNCRTLNGGRSSNRSRWGSAAMQRRASTTAKPCGSPSSHGPEGVTAKRLSEPYRPGEGGWTKRKNRAWWRYESEREAANARASASIR